MPIVKLLILVVLAAIVFSLGSALWQLARGTGDSAKMLRALTWRISLSVALFVLLFIAWYAGLLKPLGTS